MSGISKVFAGEIVEEGKQQIKEHRRNFFFKLKTNLILGVIKLNPLCSYSIGCLWKVGRHTTTATQAHEGSSEETEEQRADSKQQIQADPFSLRILMKWTVAGLKKDVVMALLTTPQPSKHLFYQLRRMADQSIEEFSALWKSPSLLNRNIWCVIQFIFTLFSLFVCELIQWDLRCFNSFSSWFIFLPVNRKPFIIKGYERI